MDAQRLEDFEVVNILEDSGTATTKVVRDKKDGTMVALKSLPISSEDAKADIIQEMDGLFKINHPTISAYHSSFLDGQAMHTKREYMDQGSLFDVYMAAGPLPEDVLATIAARALKGLIHLHHDLNPPVIHRNIKPYNIMLNHNGEVKLTDFGLSKKLTSITSSSKTVVGGALDTKHGLACYMSPERINASKYNINSDIWALGLSILEAAVGSFPYPQVEEYYDLLDIISEKSHPEPPEGASEEFVEFINKCLEHDCRDRPNAHDLLEDKFIKRGIDSPVDLASFLAALRESNPQYNENFPLSN